MPVNNDMLKGSTVVLVLNMLDRKSMYGYEMIKEMERESSGVFSFKEGTLYPILHSLESKNMIESYWWGNEGGRQRKYYRITAKGKSELKEKKQEWATFRSTVDRLLSGEVFAWA